MVLGTVCLFWKVFITLKEIQVPESGKLLLVEPGSWEMFLCGIQNPWPLGESTIPLKESGIPQTITIRNPISTDEDRNPVPGIQNLPRGIQNPRLSWIPLHWTKVSFKGQIEPEPLPGWSL